MAELKVENLLEKDPKYLKRYGDEILVTEDFGYNDKEELLLKHPIRKVTRDEYELLTEEEKKSGAIYIVQGEGFTGAKYISEISDDPLLKYSTQHVSSNNVIFRMFADMETKIENLRGALIYQGIMKADSVSDIETQLTSYVRAKKEGKDPTYNDYVKVYSKQTDDSYKFYKSYVYNGTQWEIYSDTEILNNATQQVTGAVKMATEEDVKIGTDTEKAVTSKDIQTAIDQIELFYDEL